MTGNTIGSNTVIHSTTTMEFPKAKQEQLQKLRESKQMPTYKKPMMQPVLDNNAAIPAMPIPIVPVQAQSTTGPRELPSVVQRKEMPSMASQIGVADHHAVPQFKPPPVAHQSYPMEQSQVPSVPNTMPGFTAAISDSEGTSLALPSRFGFYSFKDLYAVPFKAKHIAKLQRAHREQSLLPLVEAVASVVYTTEPGHPAIAFELTLPDFYFVLYWLRLNAFTKSNYFHRTECENPDHMKRVEDGYRLDEYKQLVIEKKMTIEEFAAIEKAVLPESSLQIAELIRQSNITVRELEAIPDPEVFHFSDTSQMYFRAPTMKDVIEFADAPEMDSKETRTEFSFLAQMASHIQHRTIPLSLHDRVKIVEEATSDQVQLLKDFEKAVKDYGVNENVKVTCKGCGASKDSKLVLDAFSFLPTN
jgi:hypothetical protein